MKLALHFIFIHIKMVFLAAIGAVVATAIVLVVEDGIKLHNAGVPVLPLSGFFQSK